MKKSELLSKIKNITGVALALIFAVMAGFFMSDVVEAAGTDEIAKATQCSFVVPSTFLPGEEPGLFISESYPMESSSIKYSIYENSKDKVLTNREKQAIFDEGATVVEDRSTSLTKEIYQQTMEEAYRNEFGKDVGFTVTDFDKKIFDGYPGYKVMSEYQSDEELKVCQTVYIIISRYKTFTITYQRAEDDECQELFDKSAATIHVR